VIDLGVVRDEPKSSKQLRKAAAVADAVVTSGGVSVGEADFTKETMAKLAKWCSGNRHAPRPPDGLRRIRARWKIGVSVRPARQSRRRHVTFYHFVRGALLTLMGRTDTDLPLLRAKAETPCARNPDAPIPARNSAIENGEWSVRITGAQARNLSSMSEANCFVVLAHEQGAVKAGDYVEVMVMDGLV